MMADVFYVGMRVRVIEGWIRTNEGILNPRPGTIVEYDDEGRLYKVQFEMPSRGQDDAGLPIYIGGSHIGFESVTNIASAWYTEHRMLPDIAAMRDERIKSIME